LSVDSSILDELMAVIRDRWDKRPEGSYTSYLFNEGQDKILKKVGEETSEVIVASKNNEKDPLVYEMADLVYHLMVLMAYHDLTWNDIYQELGERFK
jgi:phosphoribosyl-ATP pyrophosphohydrolase/phosphoribosyl-AMP cyclohydrolase